MRCHSGYRTAVAAAALLALAGCGGKAAPAAAPTTPQRVLTVMLDGAKYPTMPCTNENPQTPVTVRDGDGHLLAAQAIGERCSSQPSLGLGPIWRVDLTVPPETLYVVQVGQGQAQSVTPDALDSGTPAWTVDVKLAG